MRNSKPVLLAEDDIVDAMTVERALGDLEISNQLIHKINGEEALEYLRSDSNEKPCVILMDLNMPKMNGLEFLRLIKADETSKEIPVIVLTTSNEEQDIDESFKLGAAGYMVKPVDYKEFLEKIRVIDSYCTLIELPNRG